jgi:predicted glycosyltransferase
MKRCSITRHYGTVVRYLFDVVHPAHVHCFRYLIADLEAAGHQTFVVARTKDVTTELLDAYEIPYVTVGRATQSGLVTQGIELVRRDWAILRIARAVRPDVIVTRNPAGVQVARLTRTQGVFDTDDGTAVGIHFRAAAPFASVITTPDCIGEDYGAKHRKYPSYKALAFLHPDRFTPDPSILAELGVRPGDRYFVVRLVAFGASHDRHEHGLDAGTQRELVARLQRHGTVFVSSESPLPPDLEPLAFRVPAHRIHDALAFATLCVTDGQSMAGEAAVLGVRAVRLSSFSGRLAVLRDMQARYGLVSEFRPGEDREFLREVEGLAAEVDVADGQARRARLLDEKCDLTTWLYDMLTRMEGQPAA